MLLRGLNSTSNVCIAINKFRQGSRACIYCLRHSPHCFVKQMSSSVRQGGCAVQVLQGFWFEPARHLRGQLGGIVSNPPYIPEAQMATLQVSARCAFLRTQQWAVQAA